MNAADPSPSTSAIGPARIWTIPNLISVGRLLCVPWFLWLLWARDDLLGAAALLAVLGATDWVDGYIARHWDQGSNLGKILDPTADRVLLVAAAIGMLTVDLPVAVQVLVWVVLIREALIGAVAIALAIAGARRIDVVWAGKAGTLAIMVALPMLLAAEGFDGTVGVLFAIGGWAFAIGGVVLGYYAALKYVPAAREALREGRAGHDGAEVHA